MKNLIIILLLLFATSGVKSQEIKSVEQANGLSTGQKAPVFSALDADSTTFQLQKALQNGPQFTLLYDEGYRIVKAYDVAFKRMLKQG